MSERFDLVVIGSGPGGYVAAIRAAQLGMKVACVEKDKVLGGTCLNVGCIPSKVLLESSHQYAHAQHGLAAHGVNVSGVSLDLATMMKRKDTVVKTQNDGVAFLLKKNKIERVDGLGTLVDANTVEVTPSAGTPIRLNTARILLATGSVPASISGVTVDQQVVVDSTGALVFAEVPKHLVVIGAGVIGLELGSVWARLGAKVTVLEYLDKILGGMDGELSTQAQRLFARQGLGFELRRRVATVTVEGGRARVSHSSRDGGDKKTVDADRVLVATGRKPFTEGLGLAKVGIAVDSRGCIPVDPHLQTPVKGVFAIGDVIAGPMLAHKAEDEGIAVAEYMASGVGHVNYDAIPGIVYTHPEVASVGRTEEELKNDATPYRKGSAPFRPNGRARALGALDGFVKILADQKTDRILGAHILGACAGDLIAEVAVAMDMQASAEDLARSCHAHPTLSEVVREAALAACGRAIHA